MAAFAEAVPPVIAAGDSSAFERRPGWGPWLFMAPLLLWLLLFVVAPTLLLVVYSFAERDALGRIVFHFTWQNYLRAFDWQWLKILLYSIWYAFLTTVICMVVGFPAAYFIGRAPERFRNLLMTLVMIPFWTSFLIRTYAWITILSRDGFLNAALLSSGLTNQPLIMMYTPFAVVLGLVYNYLPFMILPIYTSVEKLDNALVEAAYDLGAGPVRAFSRVIIPLTRPGIAAGALLVFVPAIAMFAITTLMGGGANPTIGEVIQKQFTAASNPPFGAALGTLLLLLFFISLWFTRSRRAH
ncbi:MAG: ABC transporter permease [Terrimicrobiaceae bacterium]|nr:ABC transporter permease [Terrimicrobiaceae bacterium]